MQIDQHRPGNPRRDKGGGSRLGGAGPLADHQTLEDVRNRPECGAQGGAGFGLRALSGEEADTLLQGGQAFLRPRAWGVGGWGLGRGVGGLLSGV